MIECHETNFPRKLSQAPFFYFLGVVGSVEQDTMTLGAGMVRMGAGLGCFWLFCKLSGAFEPIPSRKRKSR